MHRLRLARFVVPLENVPSLGTVRHICPCARCGDVRDSVPAASAVTSAASRVATASSCSAAVVSIAGRQLLVDGAPFVVRGVAYSPLLSYAQRAISPPDLFTLAHRHIWERDLAALQAMGANVLRVYNW